MKKNANLVTLVLILFVVLKVIDFENPSWIDVCIVVLFMVNAALDIILLFRKGGNNRNGD